MNIAVVIATYNGEHFLREQLDSVLAQTLMPSEIIIQDDNSQDGTWCLLENYQRKYPGVIRIYRNDKSLGPHENFIKAFQYVTADYIAPCDQDDIWMPEKLEYMYNALIGGNYSIVACKEYIRYEDGRIVPNHYPIPAIEDCIFNHCIAGHLILVPKKAIEVFTFSDRINFDLGFVMWGICNGVAGQVEYRGVLWRRHPNVVTAEYSNHNPYKLENFSKWKKLFLTIKMTMKGEMSVVIQQRQHALCQIIRYFAKNRKELYVYERLAVNMMKQRPLNLLKAGIILGHIKSHSKEYKAYGIKDRIANRLFNFCYPCVFWYDYHKRKAL